MLHASRTPFINSVYGNIPSLSFIINGNIPNYENAITRNRTCGPIQSRQKTYLLHKGQIFCFRQSENL